MRLVRLIFVIIIETVLNNFETPIKQKDKDKIESLTPDIQKQDLENKSKVVPLKLTDYNEPDVSHSKSEIKNLRQSESEGLNCIK